MAEFLSLKFALPSFEEGRIFIDKVHMVLHWSIEWFIFSFFPNLVSSLLLRGVDKFTVQSPFVPFLLTNSLPLIMLVISPIIAV